VSTFLVNWPAAKNVAGKDPVVSDGFHTKAELEAWRAWDKNPVGKRPPKTIRTHRGVDIMYRRPKNVDKSKAGFPFGSVGFYAPAGEYERPIVAVAPGRVTIADPRHREGGKVTGGAVVIQHADGYGTAYHHLARVFARVGDELDAGDLIGIMGGSPGLDIPGERPIFAGLVHLHFDVALNGCFLDPAPFLKGVPALNLEQVWGEAVSVGPPDE
jgi:hypothetical protein